MGHFSPILCLIFPGAQVKMAAALSGSMVRGWQNGKYKVSLPIDLSVTTPLALASQNTRRGGDGGWARVRGCKN